MSIYWLRIHFLSKLIPQKASMSNRQELLGFLGGFGQFIWFFLNSRQTWGENSQMNCPKPPRNPNLPKHLEPSQRRMLPSPSCHSLPWAKPAFQPARWRHPAHRERRKPRPWGKRKAPTIRNWIGLSFTPTSRVWWETAREFCYVLLLSSWISSKYITQL